MTEIILKKINHDYLKFYQVLGLNREPIYFECMDKVWTLNFSHNYIHIPGRTFIEFDWGGSQCGIYIDESWINTMASAIAGDFYIRNICSELRDFVVDAALSDFSNLIEITTRKRLSVISTFGNAHDIKENNTSLGFQLKNQESILCGELCLNPVSLSYFCNSLNSVEYEKFPLDCISDVPINVRIQIGWTDLIFNKLIGIESGDVILLDECLLSSEDIIYLSISNGIGFRGKLEGSRIIILNEMEKFMNDVEVQSQNRDEMLDEINFRLTFDLGEKTLTIGELRTITSGYIFDLGRDLRRSVIIRANGHAIGEGELVDIDGMTGVSILRFNFKNTSSDVE